jgi:hypothetical protein
MNLVQRKNIENKNIESDGSALMALAVCFSFGVFSFYHIHTPAIFSLLIDAEQHPVKQALCCVLR